MKSKQKILYYLRLLLFVTTLILMFITIKNYIKVGLWGYLFFIFEFMYIISILITILSKKKIYKIDFVFNIMNIGTYIYQIILSSRMFSFKVTTLVKESFSFYRNNFIILIILLVTLIFYTIILNSDICKKNGK